MTSRPLTRLLLLLIALGVVERPASGGEPPLDEELPESAWDEPPEPEPPPEPEAPDWDALGRTWVVHTRFLDAHSRLPIPGVIVRLHPEVPHPEASFGVPMGLAVSGVDGRAVLRHDQLDPALVARYGGADIAIAEAPGYAVLGRQWKAVHLDWEMVPAERVTLTVIDEIERPVEGALVSWVLGCGHTPDARQGRTDAAGRVTFEGVARDEAHDPDVVVLKEGYELALVTRVPADGVPIRLHPGRVLEGRVLDAAGAPVAGAAVGLPHFRHRGPWTRTDGHGDFRLMGVPARASGLHLHVERQEYPLSRTDEPIDLRLPVPERRTPFVLRLPAPGASHEVDAPADGAEDPPRPDDAVDVDVEVVWSGEGPDVASTRPDVHWRVVAVRAEDGARVRALAEAEGHARLRLRPGAHELVVRAWQADAVRGTWDAANGRWTGDRERMPASPPIARADVRVEVEPATARTVRVTLPRPRLVRARHTPPLHGAVTLLAEGKVLAYLDEQKAEQLLLVPASAALRLVLADDDELVEVPAEIDAEGVLLVPPRPPRPLHPALHLLAPDGSGLLQPAGSVSVEGLRADLTRAVDSQAVDGWDDTRDLRLLVPGARVEIASWRCLPRDVEHVVEAPWAAVLEGPGPWDVRAPRGELVLHIERELEIEPPQVSLQVDGRVAERVRGPEARVVGLADGPHEVVLRAEGHRARRLRFTLAEGQALRWDARLRAR